MLEFSKRDMRSAIVGVTIGNIFEWYEIYTYIYLAPTMSKLFFAPDSGIQGIVNIFLIFAVGFLTRPFGGIFFGRLGDLIGRRKVLILSVVLMSVPTFLMGLMPTYEQIGYYSSVLLVIVRLLQSFPAGGEFPGAFCYLYESAPLTKRRFMSSWGAVGNQVGIIFALVEGYILDSFLSPEQLLNWGWRVAFISGSFLGFGGFLIRLYLHETPLFKDIIRHNKITHRPIIDVIIRHKSGIIRGILYCFLDAVAFYLLSSSIPVYFRNEFGVSYSDNILITLFFLVLTTLLLPFFGKLGDRYNNKHMLILSSVAIFFLTIPFHYFICEKNIIMSLSVYVLIVFFMSCLSALIPYLLSSLFPTAVRFTCVALSFNLVDGIIGGFSPLITLDLIKDTGHDGMFVWVMFISAIISLIAYFNIRVKDLNKSW